MGSEVFFSCECGLAGSARTGGGIQSANKLCLYPAYCETCKKVVEVNLLADIKCPECAEVVVPYTDQSLVGVLGDRVVDTCYDFKLTNGSYRCPKCGKMSLYFEHGYILWD